MRRQVMSEHIPSAPQPTPGSGREWIDVGIAQPGDMIYAENQWKVVVRVTIDPDRPAAGWRACAVEFDNGDIWLACPDTRVLWAIPPQDAARPEKGEHTDG